MLDTLSGFSHISELLEAMPDALVIVNNCGSILLINRQTELLFGYDRSDLLGKPIEILMPIRFRTHHVTYRKNYAANARVRPMGTGRELYGLKKDGTEFPVDISLSSLDANERTLIIATIRDSTEQKSIQEKLKSIAEHDPLTGLVNMPLFKDRVAHGIELAKRNKAFMAVFFVDLDCFKQINDSYGHETGDLLLCAASHCLQTAVRKIDTVARIGGDEFALSLLEIKNENDAVEIAKKIIHRFSSGFIIHDKKLTITLSIGISLYPNDGHQSLIEKADSAMYYVKKHGKNNFKLFDSLCDQ
jgi:diguanylate cyclase (GGDEF)-like protein/PAS domain S-box-containing protein